MSAAGFASIRETMETGNSNWAKEFKIRLGIRNEFECILSVASDVSITKYLTDDALDENQQALTWQNLPSRFRDELELETQRVKRLKEEIAKRKAAATKPPPD